jgi:hypothetical protein
MVAGLQEDSHHGESPQHRRVAQFLIIYAPRRGILEVKSCNVVNMFNYLGCSKEKHECILHGNVVNCLMLQTYFFKLSITKLSISVTFVGEENILKF